MCFEIYYVLTACYTSCASLNTLEKIVKIGTDIPKAKMQMEKNSLLSYGISSQLHIASLFHFWIQAFKKILLFLLTYWIDSQK